MKNRDDLTDDSACRILYHLNVEYSIAGTYTRLGENDQALRLLEEAFKERLDHLVLLKVDPIFDPLRADPRFQALLGRIAPAY